MIYAKEYKFITDLVAFINKNSITKEDIIKIGTKSFGDKKIPDSYFIIFDSCKESFEEVPVTLTV